MTRRFLGSPARVMAVVALALYIAYVALAAAQAPGGGARPTVWDGVFTEEQAARGRLHFAQHCAECHGGDLTGGEGKPLVGDEFWTDWRETTVDYLLTRITTSMPRSEDGALAGTLPASTYEDLVAYILERNEFPAGARELTRAASTGVQIIRKDGPGALPASTLARVVGCLAPRGANKEWSLTGGTEPVRITETATAVDTSVPLGPRQYALKFVLKPLDKFVGYRMVVTGLLLGDGGVNGVNVSTIEPVSETCK
ncbi:MAG TPA: cytochrome c [Vicinamibacterales bacterium]|nr:cytochrome c [Vicinamibacterales bacterium]